MSAIPLPHADAPAVDRPLTSRDIEQAIPQLGALLPFQGPISSFVFLNPLQGLEDLPFDEAVRLGAEIFGCAPYLSEERYFLKQQQGRITAEELSAVLVRELGPAAQEPVGPRGTRLDFRLRMLTHRMHLGPPEEMAWWIAETDALKRLQQDVPEEIQHDFVRRSRTWILQAGTSWPGWPQAEYGTPGDDWSDQLWEQASLACLWKVVLQGVERVELQPARPSRQRRLRDRLEQLTGIDTDLAVHELLIRLCAAMADPQLAGPDS